MEFEIILLISLFSIFPNSWSFARKIIWMKKPKIAKIARIDLN